MILSRVQVYSLLRSQVLLKLETDQVLVFHWIAGSCQVNLTVEDKARFKSKILTVSSLQMFFVYSFSDFFNSI